MYKPTWRRQAQDMSTTLAENGNNQLSVYAATNTIIIIIIIHLSLISLSYLSGNCFLRTHIAKRIHACRRHVTYNVTIPYKEALWQVQ